MEFFFENQFGKLRFQCRGRRGDGIFVQSVSGLGMAERVYKSTVFSGQAGRTVLSFRELERVITLTVDVYSRKNLQKAFRNILEILYHPGEFFVYKENIFRKIACNCTMVGEPEKHGRELMRISLQFTCDDPYFTDLKPEAVTIFSRQDLIQNEFVLPCIFTEKTTSASVVNQGIVPAHPVLSIYHTGNVENPSEQPEDYGITFHNRKTGEMLKLLYHLKPGEIVTLDIPKRTVTSNVSGNLIEYLSPDSFLNRFYLEPGENHIEIINQNTEEMIDVIMTYDNRYIEAVI